MKKTFGLGATLFLVIFLLFGTGRSLHAQALDVAEVPEKAIINFQKYVPGVVAEWAMEGDMFGAAFRKGTSDYVYVFNPAGTLLRKKMQITQADLPPAVKADLEKNHPNAGDVQFFQVISRDRKKFYEVSLEEPTRWMHLRYNPAGAVVHSRTEVRANALPQEMVAGPAESETPERSEATDEVEEEITLIEPEITSEEPTAEVSVAMRGEEQNTVATDGDTEILEEDYDFEEGLDMDWEEEMPDLDEEDNWDMDADLWEMEEEDDLDNWDDGM